MNSLFPNALNRLVTVPEPAPADPLHTQLFHGKVFHSDLPDHHPAADDPFGLVLPVLLVANKADLDPDSRADVAALEELLGLDYPAMVVSAEIGLGLDRLGTWLFDRLAIVRVYTKVPGKPADHTRPFALRRGQIVADVARLVHRDLAENVKYARLWNAAHEGQHVGRDHVDG